MSVFEMRVVLTIEGDDRLVSFYRDGLGLEPGDLWADHGNGLQIALFQVIQPI
jgi:hypothetical protein